MTFREELRLKYPKMHVRAEAGSRKASMRLMCLECVGGDVAEITRCTDGGCPMYQWRPKTQNRPSEVSIIDTCEASE
jgi:hypothetical protein